MKASCPIHCVEKRVMLALFFCLSLVTAGLGQTISPVYKPPFPIIGPYAAPIVRIISPADHSVFKLPESIQIVAYVRQFNIESGFTNVEFYAGTNNLGAGHRVILYPPVIVGPETPIPILPPISQPEYLLTWTNPPAGSYSLTAVAKGSILSITSAPINIIVVSPTVTPPTNKVDIVSVVATDPIAIAGTNCWVYLGSTNISAAWSNWPPAAFNLITNCGPKSATFTIRRFGPTSNALPVGIHLTGTASNTVDYTTVGTVSNTFNYVTIPAGMSSMQLTIVPTDAVSSNLLAKTVILNLLPEAFVNWAVTTESYIVGVPSRAEAIIYEGMPHPFPWVLGDGTFHLTAAGPDGAWFVVQRSLDSLNWTPICTNQVVQGSVDFVDPDAATNSAGFYRAVPQ